MFNIIRIDLTNSNFFKKNKKLYIIKIYNNIYYIIKKL